MTSELNPYMVRATNNGGTTAGGHMRGYAWGPPTVEAVTMDSLDRYRVTLHDYPDVLLIHPQQEAVWRIPNGQTLDGKDGTIDGDGTWMCPERIPAVEIGQPLDLCLAFLPCGEPDFWHRTSPVTGVTVTVGGQPVDEMATGWGSQWVIETATGPVHEFDFNERPSRHRRFVSRQAFTAGNPDTYPELYALYDIGMLKIGEPIRVDAWYPDDLYPLDAAGEVATITNVFDSWTTTPDKTGGDL